MLTYPSITRNKTQTKDVLAIAENIEILTGRRGQGLDKAITRRDLIDLGWLGSRIQTINGAQTFEFFDNTGGGVVVTPPKPTNVQASGNFTGIILTWDIPHFSGFAYAEVWRADIDEFGQAFRAATTISAFHVDPVGVSASYYYWVRFVNTNDEPGPLHDTAGVFGQSASDPAEIIGILTGKITQTELHSTLSDPIDLITGPDTLVGSVNERIKTLRDERLITEGVLQQNIDTLTATVGVNTASITSEATIRQTNDDLIAQSVTDLTLTVNTNTADILTEQIVRGSADSAMAGDILLLQTSTGDNAAAIAVETIARTDADSAIAVTAAALAVTVAANGAAITTEQTARADGDSASSSSIATLTTTVGGNTASIQTVSSTVDGISAEQYVKLDVNGYVAGFGIFNQGPGASGFIVRSDLFGIAIPSEPDRYLFTAGVVNGVASVGIDAELFVIEGTIKSLHVETLTADKITVAGLPENPSTIAEVIIGEGHITNAHFGNFIQSEGWDGVHGFHIDTNTGLIQANALTLLDTNGNLILDTTGNYAAAISNSSQQYSDVTGGPPTDADKTSSNTAAGIANQGNLATQNSVTYSTQVSGGPPSNADRTADNTAAGINNQGDLATQDSVNYSTEVSGGPPTNADNTASNTAAGIANQGSLATASQIAAVHIPNAIIGTLHVAGNAITAAAGANGTNTCTATITITDAGQTFIIGSAWVIGTGPNVDLKTTYEERTSSGQLHRSGTLHSIFIADETANGQFKKHTVSSNGVIAGGRLHITVKSTLHLSSTLASNGQTSNAAIFTGKR